MDLLTTDFNLIQMLIWLLVIFLSIAFHEYCHGWMASELGDDTAEREGRLTLNPISHIDPIGSIVVPLILLVTNSPFLFGWAKPVPYNPANLRNQRWGSALVAAAGPVSNLVIAIFASICFRIIYAESFATGVAGRADSGILQFFALLAIINISLAVFNLIPVPPLDGSKLLASILPGFGKRMFDTLERFGVIVVFIFLVVFFQALSPILGRIIFGLFRLLSGV